MPDAKPRVAIGPLDAAGCATALAGGLRAHGVDAEAVLSFRHRFGYPADRVLGRARRLAYGLAAPLRRDVLHYQFGTTWIQGFVDARWARLLQRTVVVTYHGDDCRLYGLTAAFFPAQRGATTADAVVRRRVARLARFCDAAIVKDLELATYVYPFFGRVYVMASPVRPLERPRDEPRTNGVPIVLHAPSDPRFKGTDDIRAAVEAVAERIPLDFRVATRMPHETLMDELARADVAVDQLNAVATGVFALEAMQRRVPVLAEYDPSVLPAFQRDVPIVRVTRETLEDELESLLTDDDRRAQLGELGVDYVERTHAAARVAAATLGVYRHARTAAPGLYEATEEGIEPLSPSLAERLDEARVGASP